MARNNGSPTGLGPAALRIWLLQGFRKVSVLEPGLVWVARVSPAIHPSNTNAFLRPSAIRTARDEIHAVAKVAQMSCIAAVEFHRRRAAITHDGQCARSEKRAPAKWVNNLLLFVSPQPISFSRYALEARISSVCLGPEISLSIVIGPR